MYTRPSILRSAQAILLGTGGALAIASIVGDYIDVNNMQVTYHNCYVDSTGARVLNSAPGPGLNGSVLTVEACALACSALNFAVSGVEFGGECYCASSLPSGLTISTNCVIPCNGNASEICGGGDAINIYSQTLLSATATANITSNSLTYLGCFNAGSSGTFISSTSGSNTISSCGAICADAGYSHMGVSDTTCKCYSSIWSGIAGSGTCTTECPGDSLQLCGDGATSITGYSTGTTLVPSATGLISSYLSVTGSTFSFSGCYHDNDPDRILGESIVIELVTPQLCMDACSAAGFAFAGVEYSSECWCGNSLGSSSQWSFNSGTWSPLAGGNLDSHCTMPCAGDNTVSCGGPNALQIYGTATFGGFLSSVTDYKGETLNFVGCYSDNSTDSPAHRTFAIRDNTIDGAAMTPQKCALACQLNSETLNAVYSGVEYGGECWCSTTPPASELLVSQAMCMSMRCTGNSGLWCAGGDLLAVYSTTAPILASIVNSYGSVTYQGCFADSAGARVLNQYYVSIGIVEDCVTLCSGLGFAYAGLEDGSSCFCGHSLISSLPLTSCTTACSTATHEICGGTDAISVYTTATTKPFIAAPDVSADVQAAGNVFATLDTSNSVYVGCAVDSVDSRVLSIRSSLAEASVTPIACIDDCTARGYNYAGVEYGAECWCGKTATGLTLDPFGCTMSCSGDSNYACGDGNRLSVYYNGGANPLGFVNSVAGFTLQGCYSDDSGSRTLRFQQNLDFNNMTPAICTAACQTGGYAYAGVEWAGQCFCDFQLTSSPLGSNDTCNSICSGSATTFCGGGNAINIYHNPSLTRTIPLSHVSGNVTWNYKACWHEPEPAGTRALPFIVNNPAGTVEGCLDLGASLNYTACGLEYGGECWCDIISSDPPGLQISESACSTQAMTCSGNVLEYCGAGYIFAFYSTGSQSYTPIP